LREFSLLERECAGEWILASRAKRHAHPPQRTGWVRRQSTDVAAPLAIPSVLVGSVQLPLAVHPLLPVSVPSPPVSPQHMIHFGGFDPIHLAAPEIAETAPLIPAHAAPAQFSNCSPVGLPSAPLAPSVAVNPMLAPASPERDTEG
jgi:hypothetical protein